MINENYGMLKRVTLVDPMLFLNYLLNSNFGDL